MAVSISVDVSHVDVRDLRYPPTYALLGSLRAAQYTTSAPDPQAIHDAVTLRHTRLGLRNLHPN